MQKLIVETWRGLLSEVYSNEPEVMDLIEINEEDPADKERQQEYWKSMWPIQRGCCRPVTKQESSPYETLSSQESARNLTALRGLFPESEEVQQAISFIDGFLAAWGMMNQYQRERDRSGQMTEGSLGRVLSPLADRLDEVYSTLYENLWALKSDSDDEK